jgi:asparagine synthase (glutamine-hydrolysing)
MYGIDVILTVSKFTDYLESIIDKIQASLRHRGLNDQGVYLSSDRRTALTHTRYLI